MKIMVFDVPAEESGALSILQDFFAEVESSDSDKMEWFLVLSKPVVPERSNLKVLRFPWIKKSWFHRLFFDYAIAPRLIKKYKIDKVISLQNMVIPFTNIEQTLYVHNPMPFTEYRFGLFSNPKYWIYQNVIGRMITNSINKADKVVVQSNWMRRYIIESFGVSADRIFKITPKINLEVKKTFSSNRLNHYVRFFYPANAYVYKNHEVICQACEILLQQGEKNFEVIFTLNGDESPHIKELYKQAITNKLPIRFVGILTREQVFDFYSKSVLLFPSYIETFGLPLLEAMMHQCIILASDTVFSREILEGYKNAHLFDPFRPDDLANLMIQVIQNKITFNDSEIEPRRFISDHLSILDIAIAKLGEAIG